MCFDWPVFAPSSPATVLKTFDFRPGMIGKDLDLKRGGDRYIHTAAYGHFGRSDRPDVFTWEKVLPLKDA